MTGNGFTSFRRNTIRGAVGDGGTAYSIGSRTKIGISRVVFVWYVA